VSKGTSAASVAKLLKGIDFPVGKDDLVKQIQQNKGEVEDDDNIDTVIDIINQMSDKQYNSMTDVEHEVGQVK
jgi:deoxyribose-phosphate aldolase